MQPQLHRLWLERNEQEILSRLKEGDEQAFRTIFGKYSAYVYNVANKYLNSPIESEEIVQEVFFKIWMYRGKIKEELPFTPYLITIAKNIVFNHSKHQLVEEAYLQYLEHRPKLSSLSAESSVHFKEVKKVTDEYVDTLPEIRKKVFKLSRVENFSTSEISHKLSISERTVENHIYRALKSLRTHLQTMGYTEFLILLPLFC